MPKPRTRRFGGVVEERPMGAEAGPGGPVERMGARMRT